MQKPVMAVFSKILLIYAGVPLVGNAAAIIFSIFVTKATRTEQLKVYMNALEETGVGLTSQLAPFPIVTGFIIWYIWPIISYTLSNFNPLKFNDEVTARTLNSPFMLAMLSLGGWGIALVINTLGSLILMGSIEWSTFLLFTYNVFLNSFLCVVIVYYLVEFLNRKFLLSHMIDHNRELSTYGGIYNFSVQTRFLFLFFSVGVFPVLVAFRVFYGIRAGADVAANFDILFFIFFILGSTGLLLTYLLGRSFSVPLKMMQESTLRIRDEDFDVEVPVRSTDEIGYLAESLNVMAHELKEKEEIKETFGKVVDPNVRDYLLNNQVELGGDLVEATVLFTDIRGFTSISENMNPEEIVHLLNRYFERMSNCITEHRGLVNKYIGDAIMAIFGVPVPLDNHAQAAASCALAMQSALKELNQQLEQEGLPAIKTGIGLHSGEVLAGNIGSSNRLEYTVIGDNVNLASRIESLCKSLKTDLLLTEATFKQLSQPENFEFFHSVKVKGKKEITRIYRQNITQV